MTQGCLGMWVPGCPPTSETIGISEIGCAVTNELQCKCNVSCVEFHGLCDFLRVFDTVAIQSDCCDSMALG